MKRNLSLMREILLYIEKVDSSELPIFTQPAMIPGSSHDEVIYQIKLLGDKKFIEGTANDHKDGWDYIIERMTFDGHEYLDAVRDEKIWTKVLTKASKIGGEITLDIAKQLAIMAIKDTLGLPSKGE